MKWQAGRSLARHPHTVSSGIWGYDMSDEAMKPTDDAADGDDRPGQRTRPGRGDARPKGWVSLATDMLDLAEDFDPPRDTRTEED